MRRLGKFFKHGSFNNAAHSLGDVILNDIMRENSTKIMS